MKWLRKSISIFAMLLFVHTSYAQLGFCSGNSGDAIFTETFGEGTTYGPQLPAGTTTYNFVANSGPQDGEYTVGSNTFSYGWNLPSDHTPNDTNGKCLIVNANFTSGEFYKRTVSGLCENTTYEFSSWVKNILPSSGCGGNGIPVNVRFEIWDNSNINLLASGNTGNIFGQNSPNWIQYGLVFQTLPGQTSVILKMINNGIGGCGNDLAIDDIVFKTCGDSVVIETINADNSFEACEDTMVTSVPLNAIPDFSVFSSHAYQWQVSSNGITWTDISGANNNTYNAPAPIPFGNLFYRVKFAESSSNLQNSSCNSFSEIFEITINPLVTPSFNSIPPICNGGTFALPSTSTNGITGTWSPALNNMTTTTYTFTPNAGQCARNRTLIVTVNQPVTPNFNAIAPICSGTTISLPTTSTNMITGTWSPAINNTTTATYTFTPNTGQCATTQTLTIVVNQPITPTFAPISEICSGDTLSALPTTSTNNINGTWSPSLNNTATTTYTFTPNAGQCATNQNLTIVVNQPITPTFNSIAGICIGDTLSPLPTNSTNNITGTWSPALNNTMTTTYTFTPNAGQCATTQTLTIDVNSVVTPNFNQAPPICSGDSFSLPLTSTNNITGTWSPVLNNTSTTTYTFTPNAGQCASNQMLTVTVNQPVTPNFNTIPPICNGDAFSLPTTSLNNISGTWLPAINNTTTTTYTFTPNTGECATTQTLTVVVNQPIIPMFAAVPAICSGDMLSALPTTSINMIAGTWSPSINNTATTTYTFTPNAGQCATTQSLTIVINQPTTPTFAPIAAICDGETLSPLPTISTNSIIGTWSPPLDNTMTITYTFTPNTGQCATTQTLTIVVNQLVTPTFNAVPAICIGETLSPLPTTSTNNITGTWSPALNNTTTTTYIFTPNAGQCATTQTLTIIVNQSTIPTFDPIAPICSGDKLSPLPATSTNNITGTWSPELNNSATTTYTFTPDVGQCRNLVTLTIVVNSNPMFELDENYVICINTNGTEIIESTTIFTNLSETDYSFEWTNNASDVVGINSSYLPLTGGIYTVLVTNILTGCQSEASTFVIESSPPDLSITQASDPFSDAYVIEVSATGLGDYEYSLDNGSWQDSPVFSNVSSGNHVITARDKNGCGFTNINVCLIGYSKFFTPNGDGFNDTWNIKGASCINSAEIFIFDRFGKLLKQIDFNGRGWNGTFNGNLLPTSDYWFVIKYIESGTTTSKEFRGNFTLKR